MAVSVMVHGSPALQGELHTVQGQGQVQVIYISNQLIPAVRVQACKNGHALEHVCSQYVVYSPATVCQLHMLTETE
uniref:Uncharacterized protein n=1 Tax=Dicentrarchus labrax TaxID=13489 RepID=A0A8C4NME8_DICLA